MKRFLAILLSVGMVFSLTACGVFADAKETESEDEKETIESSIDEEEEDSKESDESKDADEEQVVEDDTEDGSYDNLKLKPSDEGKIIGDYWFFASNIDDSEEYATFAYDLLNETTHIIVDSDEHTLDYIQNEHVSGNSVIIDKSICDIKTGDVLFTLAENQEFMCGFQDGHVIVKETVEAFEGNQYSLGILDTEGNWTMSLTVMDFCNEDTVYSRSYSNCKYMVANPLDNFEYDYYMLDGSTGEVTEFLYSEYEGNIPWKIVGDVEYYSNYDYNYYKISSCEYFNRATGERGTFEHLKEFDMRCGELWIKYGEQGKVTVADENEIVAEYDMSQYKEYSKPSTYHPLITKDRFFTCITNQDDDLYVCLFDKDGNKEFEPIKWEYDTHTDYLTGSYFAYLTEKKAISWYSKDVIVYDIENDNLVNRQVSYNIMSYSPEADVFVVYDTEAGYYGLVDSDDLDTVINPFE